MLTQLASCMGGTKVIHLAGVNPLQQSAVKRRLLYAEGQQICLASYLPDQAIPLSVLMGSEWVGCHLSSSQLHGQPDEHPDLIGEQLDLFRKKL
jgi:hypothetical protein